MLIDIDKLVQQAMKSRNKTDLRAYKNLKAEIQAFKTAKNAKPYDEAAEISIIKKYCEKLEKSILSFSEANRDDLVAEYTDELLVLKKWLPEPVNESEICSELLEWCRENHFTQKFQTANGYEEHSVIPKKEMGNAIKHLKSKFPQADGKLISTIVKSFVI